MTGAASEGSAASAAFGDAAAAQAGFDQLPLIALCLAGASYQIASVNAAGRDFLGRADLVGLPVEAVLPGLAGEQLVLLLDQVTATGQPESGQAWRIQLDRGQGQPPADSYLDFTILPWRAADGATGLMIIGEDVTATVQELPSAAAGAADQPPGAPAQETLADLQRALLPAGLPILPQVRIAARYLGSGDDSRVGGDWFDAIPLTGGRVALLVGDVVGHGVTACAAMAQLRAVLTELLTAESDLATVVARADRFAAGVPALQAATLAMAVLVPATGELTYLTCGHPPPLVLSGGGAARFLPATASGPLGVGASHHPATSVLQAGELLMLYSDGLVRRPGRSISAGLAELAEVAAAAAAGRALPAEAAVGASERVSRLSVELLARTGYADDIAVLAAERLAGPKAPLQLRLPAEVPSLTLVRRALRDWLAELGLRADDQDGIHMAVVETVTNAIEHAYPPGQPGPIEFDLALRPDGQLECLVTDFGTWRAPDPAAADRGNGLMVTEHMVDQLLISHPARAGGAPASAASTVIRLRHRVRHPAVLATDPGTGPVAVPAWPAFAVETGFTGASASARVRGCLDLTTADEFVRRLLAACRGGTLPLTVDLAEITCLASAGVSALCRLAGQLAAHDSGLELLAPAGSPAQEVLKIARLPYREAPASQRTASPR